MSHTKKIHFSNLYDDIPEDKTNSITNYPNKKEVRIDLPFQMTINGGTGSGKTQWLIQLIKHVGVFKEIYVIARDIKEPLYTKLEEAMGSLIKKSKNRIRFVMSDKLEDVPKVDSFDGTYNSLVVIDDFIQASEKELQPVQDIYIRGRKRNVSIVFIGHRYYQMPKLIRGNTKIVVIKRLATIKEFDRIMKELAVDKPIEELREIYKYILDQGVHNGFLIDMSTRVPDLMYRMNYTPISEISE